MTAIRMLKMINAFRDRGHLAARLDPLLETSAKRGVPVTTSWLPNNPEEHPDIVRLLRNYPQMIDLTPFDLQNVPMDKRFCIGPEIKSTIQANWTIPEIIHQLSRTYCGHVGVEFMHIQNETQREWLEDRIERDLGPSQWKLHRNEDRVDALSQLVMIERFLKFLGKKYPGAKVFGVEGCEAMIPGLNALLQTATSMGVEGIVMGMAHRGRMSVLHNFFEKPLISILHYFDEANPSDLGDVKYHLGTRCTRKIKGFDGVEREVHMSLAANPSHLEAVNPVVIGKTKAKQVFINDTSQRKVMPLLLHGDASFSGQGIVPEVMELSNLPDYTVGGCVHVVVNNQIGFTTDPRLARTSFHCTSVAKGVGAPIFHVNADDVDAVINVFRLAVEWRQTFLRDCVVDLVCYRRHGHNSLDDPSITQPLLYSTIAEHPTVMEKYHTLLESQGALRPGQFDDMKNMYTKKYEEEFEKSKSYQPDPLDWLGSNWQGAAIGSFVANRPYNQTGVKMETLHAVGECLLKVPDDFDVHRDILKLLQSRKRIIETGEGVTMAFAEALAFGCLMTKFSPLDGIGKRKQKTMKRTVAAAYEQFQEQADAQMESHPVVHVRLSGQDCIRGTFNQRHAVIYCQKTGRRYRQLRYLFGEHASINVCNSSLSEPAILGFEYGYSLGNEMALTIWEAQFGDFANVAQSIIDNFIASGESKWNNQSSLVMLLPHGYDGQGPEHSSGRLERFLSLVDDDPDSIPGKETFSKDEMEEGYEALIQEAKQLQQETDADARRESMTRYTEFDDYTDDDLSIIDDNMDVVSQDILGVEGMALTDTVTREAFIRAAVRYAPGARPEKIQLALTEILGELGEASAGLSDELTRETWQKLMASWLQSNSERR
jgi:2-oxoglutarate dehydrogenase E1 component